MGEVSDLISRISNAFRLFANLILRRYRIGVLVQVRSEYCRRDSPQRYLIKAAMQSGPLHSIFTPSASLSNIEEFPVSELPLYTEDV